MVSFRRRVSSALPGRLLAVALFAASHLAAAGAITEAEALEGYLSRIDRSTPGDTTVEMDIEANLSSLHKSAKMRMIRSVSRMGRSVFHTLASEGDAMVRREVIARFINAEAKAREVPDSTVAITPANYRFLFRGETDYAGQSAYVYRLEPKHKRVGLFKGELWLNAQTGAVLREWGEFARSPSRFIKSVYFVRDYTEDGEPTRPSVPRRLILNVSTRMFGRADVTVWFDKVASGSEAASAFNDAAPGSPAAVASREWTTASVGGE